MTYKMHGALVASLGALALVLAADQTFARSGTAPGARSASTHSISPPTAFRSPRHHRGNRVGGLWPAAGGYFYAPPNGEPVADAAQPSADIHYTYKYDVPWDWAHRFPPNVVPSDRAYVTQCPAETVTVPGAGGKDHTVNIMRCY